MPNNPQKKCERCKNGCAMIGTQCGCSCHTQIKSIKKCEFCSNDSHFACEDETCTCKVCHPTESTGFKFTPIPSAPDLSGIKIEFQRSPTQPDTTFDKMNDQVKKGEESFKETARKADKSFMPDTESWEEEFERNFLIYGTAAYHGADSNGKGARITIKDFIHQVEEKAYQRGKESWETTDTDASFEEGRHSSYREIIEMVEEFGKRIKIKHADVKDNGNPAYTEYVRACMDVITFQHNKKVDDLLSKLKEKLQ